MSDDQWASFQRRLDEEHRWPGPYTLKVVVPAGKVDEVLQRMGRSVRSRRASASGKYISLSFEWQASGSDEVVRCYRELSAVEGAVLL